MCLFTITWIKLTDHFLRGLTPGSRMVEEKCLPSWRLRISPCITMVFVGKDLRPPAAPRLTAAAFCGFAVFFRPCMSPRGAHTNGGAFHNFSSAYPPAATNRSYSHTVT